MIAPVSRYSAKKNEYKQARESALLCVGCKGGKLVISADSVWIEPESLLRAPELYEIALPRPLVTGVQATGRPRRPAHLVIHALGCRELHVDWVKLKDLAGIISLLGVWDESKPRGEMQEVIEHYISRGFVLVSRDEQGAQLTRTLGTSFRGVSAPVPIVKGVRVSGGALHQSQAVVYVRADGSVIERVSSS